MFFGKKWGGARFRSWDLWVMSPTRFHCATLPFLVRVLSMNQYVLGDSSWVFVDPLEELAVTLGTLEIEPVWVGLGVGGG